VHSQVSTLEDLLEIRDHAASCGWVWRNDIQQPVNLATAPLFSLKPDRKNTCFDLCANFVIHYLGYAGPQSQPGDIRIGATFLRAVGDGHPVADQRVKHEMVQIQQ